MVADVAQMRVLICIFWLEAVLLVQINIGFIGLPSNEIVKIEVLESSQ